VQEDPDKMGEKIKSEQARRLKTSITYQVFPYTTHTRATASSQQQHSLFYTSPIFSFAVPVA
jgi:hypothetical protein